MGLLYVKYLVFGGLFFLAGQSTTNDYVQTILNIGGVNLVVFAILFRLKVGDRLIGKNERTGKIPVWSYVLFWSFHATNFVYIYVMREIRRGRVDSGNMVVKNLWIGGWWADRVNDGVWTGIVDLTTEFPERASAARYLNLPTWDGNPPKGSDLQKGAEFIVDAMKEGPVMCHCGFGVGRSTTLCCAALVLGGFAKNVDEAFALIKAKRPVVRLNANMKAALVDWERCYVSEKDGPGK